MRCKWKWNVNFKEVCLMEVDWVRRGVVFLECECDNWVFSSYFGFWDNVEDKNYV